MYFCNDYIMRQIQMAAGMLAKMLFNKQIVQVELYAEEASGSGEGLLYHRLKKLLHGHEINQAENLLFEEMERSPLDAYLAIALQFYQAVGEFSDEELAAARFPRDEILDGLIDAGKLYGVDLTMLA